jgi:tetratricopeptide (TPR) repeat protein
MRSPSSPGRRVFFRLLLAVAIPAAFFALLEGGLRVGGFGRDPRFFIPDEAAGMWRTNPRFTESFFPASFGLKPLNFRLPRQKPAGVKRVFVLGESAAMGVPEPAFALAPQLEAQLRARLPGVRVEVHNLGVTAINSHVVARIADEALEFEPDLLVVYLGNNEVVGPWGPGSAVTGGSPPRWLIRTALAVKSTRVGQLLEWLAAQVGGTGAPREWGGMEMFRDRLVPGDDPRLERVAAHFAANLGDILASARDRGVPVVLSTVAVNLRDCAPFASLPAAEEGAAWVREFEEAVWLAAVERPAEAEAAFRRVLAAQPLHAETHFRLARLREAAGDPAGARRHYLEARQSDALRFRADERVNDLIRAAARPGDGFVDAARALGAAGDSAATPAGSELFFEHVHLTWEGNQALARLLAAEAAVRLGAGPAVAAPSPDEIAASVGFTPLARLGQWRAMEELTARPPFTAQFDFGEYRGRLEREIAALERRLADPAARRAAAMAVDRARERDPDNPRLVFQAAHAWMQAGESARALRLNDHLATLVPPSPEQAVQRAYLLQELQRPNEAESLLLATVESDPHYLQAYALLARLWASTGRVELAGQRFGEWARARPANRIIGSTHAQLLAMAGDWYGAEREWARVLRFVPDDESVLGPLVERLAETNRLDEAVEHMRRAFAYNPRSFTNNARLVQVAEERGDREAAVRYMHALAASGPVNARLHLDLAARLQALGRPDEALAALHEARRVATQEGDAEAGREAAQRLAELAAQNPDKRNR